MKIEDARKLKPGDVVRCPPDRGNPGYAGRVKFLVPDAPASKAFGGGEEYIWVTVTPSESLMGKASAVWPSNRLL
jgi:hypothetical protein